MTLLLVILALLGGFVFGMFCAFCCIKVNYPTAWRILLLEIKARKQKRADAARKEVNQ